jgi:hypothetical protein
MKESLRLGKNPIRYSKLAWYYNDYEGGVTVESGDEFSGEGTHNLIFDGFSGLKPPVQ